APPSNSIAVALRRPDLQSVMVSFPPFMALVLSGRPFVWPGTRGLVVTGRAELRSNARSPSGNLPPRRARRQLAPASKNHHQYETEVPEGWSDIKMSA